MRLEGRNMALKRKKYRFWSTIPLLLLLTLLFTLPARAADEGSFVLTASVSTRTIIEPVRIPYSAGQTVREALSASPYDFDGLNAGGFINAVEGIAGNYLVAYDGGGYDLDAPASAITAVSFAEGAVWCEETAELIRLCEPVTEDMLTAVKLCGRSDGDMVFPFPADDPFTASRHSYDLTVSDAYAAAYLQADSPWTVEAVYTTQHATVPGNHGIAKCQSVNYAVGDRRAQYLSFLLASCGYGQELVLRVTKPDTGDVRYYQEYELRICRSLHLTELSLTLGEEVLILTDEAGGPVSFERDRTELWVSVPAGSTAFTLNGSFTNETAVTPCCGGYEALLRGRTLNVLKDVNVALDAESEGEDVTLTLTHPDGSAVSTVYTLHVKQQEPVHVRFSTDPEGAVVFLWNNVTGRTVFDENGVFSLTPGASYSYHVTKNSYKGIAVNEYIAPDEDCTVPVTLSPAPDAGLTKYPAQWPSFRADDCNNGVVSARTPITAESAALSWATALGEGWDTGACGCPIIVDGALYTYAGDYLYKVDRVSGEVLARGSMDHSSSFAINNPTYGDGMIFVGLADGTVQAFSAETLEPLWIYRDPLKGQPVFAFFAQTNNA